MSQFDELLKSLQATAEEQTDGPADNADDETIAAAAADSGVSADGNPEGDVDGGDADDKNPMAKSMTAQGADGEEIEVVDATEMLKSLQSDLTEQGGVLAKALETMTSVAQKQGALIKSLQTEVRALAGQGRGRKAVISVSEKPMPGETMAKSHQDDAPKLTREQFMAKCLDAQKAHKITGLDVSRAEIAINNGVPVPADIVSRVQ